jgi:hypothetical protein
MFTPEDSGLPEGRKTAEFISSKQVEAETTAR